ncbi:septum formation initiator family protein [Streptomyces sp. NPDC007264]|uniref:septum formation initiator family protein n=1 Tax=Streptomyces sp. NPDC007264 TaxID=3364777 RepID=UPI0036D85C7A
MSRRPELRGRAARLARLIPVRGARAAARTPFVLLVVLLLGGGLIGLLVLNSALSEGAFKLDDLHRETKNLTDEEQALQRDVDAYSAPDALQRRARELGMVPGGDPAFLNPDGTVRGVPEAAAPQAAASTGTEGPPEASGPDASATASPPPSGGATASPPPSGGATASPLPSGGATASPPPSGGATAPLSAMSPPSLSPDALSAARPTTEPATPPAAPSTTPGR